MPELTIQQAFDLAQQYHKAARLHEAEQLYRKILARAPDHVGANLYLGVVAHQAGHTDDAIDLMRRAIVLKPDFAEAHNNLGLALEDKGELDEALVSHRTAHSLNPQIPQALLNIGNICKRKGQLDDAIAAYRQALAIKPGYTDAHSNLVYIMHFHPGCSARSIAEEHSRWSSRHAQPLAKFVIPHTNDRNPDRRLRIGYLSPDFRDHVVGRNLLPLFREHDRSRFEITCYSQSLLPDAMTGHFQRHADRWRNIMELSDEQAAKQVRDDRIDILVDLSLHMGNGRLLVFARKPAPVQVTFAGYPGSTGLDTIDYRLSDPYLDPPGIDESIYNEQTVRLPDSFWCYDPLDCREIPVNSLPAPERGAVTFGCLNNFCKINDDVLWLWAKVLKQVENSRLLLLAPMGSHRPRTLQRLQQQGIDPRRIEFAVHQSRQKYLQTYHRIDLGLDTFPYNGHTTSLDSFWMGVPVVTLVGDGAVARAGWCQLSNLGLQELAGQTPEQFVRIAVELATDLPSLKQFRSTLRQRMEQSPLMDAPRFTRNIEAAYRRMWHKWTESASFAHE